MSNYKNINTEIRLVHLAILFMVLLAVTEINASPFPFHINTDLIKDSAVANKNTPITDQDSIRSYKGHFYTIGKDKISGTDDDARVRFWGINLFPANTFPRDKQEAERIASRLENLGFNIVRIVALDYNAKLPHLSILDQKISYPALNKNNLHRLELLIKTLGEHGIYVDLVLEMNHIFNPGKDCIINKRKKCVISPNGLAGTKGTDDKFTDASRSLVIFDETMQELRKEFITKLLTPFINNPVIALLEIKNENSLIEHYHKPQNSIPPYYSKKLDLLWNQWLLEKYKSYSTLNSAWNNKTFTDNPDELIKHGDFEKSRKTNVSPWSLSQWKLGNTSKWGKWKITEDNNSLIEIHTIPEKHWYFFLSQHEIKLHENKVYKLSFDAKANPPRKLGINLNDEQNNKAVRINRLKNTFNIEKDQQHYTSCFRSNVTTNNARLIITPITKGSQPGRLWLDNISLTAIDSTINSNAVNPGTIPRPDYFNKSDCSNNIYKEKDYLLFLQDLELKYYQNIYSHIKSLGIKVPVTGTQGDYGGLLSQHNMSTTMDYIDAHYYWDHPHIPKGGQTNWYMTNKPMVATPDTGIIRAIISNNNAGMPLTISEYSHNSTSEYAQESLILTSALSSLHDIDGVFVLSYNFGGSGLDTRDRTQPNMLTSWYNVLGDTRAEALMQQASWLFRNFLVAPSLNTVKLEINNAARLDPPIEGVSFRDIHTILTNKKYILDKLGNSFDYKTGLYNKTKLHHVNSSTKTGFQSSTIFPKINPHEMVSDTSELTWHNNSSLPFYTIDTKTIKAVTGYFSRPINMDDLNINTTEESSHFGTLSLIPLDKKTFDTSSRILLSIVGNGFNKNTRIIKNNNGYSRCVVNNNDGCLHPFYHPFAGEFVNEPIPVNIQLNNSHKKLTVYTLNTSGEKSNVINSNRLNNHFDFKIGNHKDKTPWYLLEFTD